MIQANEINCKCIIQEVIDSNLLILYGAVFKKYRKGEYIFREGQHPQFYHQVVEGKVKMQNETEEGRVFTQGFFLPGESFGEPPIFYGGEYPAAAVAEQPSIVMRLTIPSFIQVLKENFQVHLRITKLLAERLKSKSTSLKEICCFNPEHRILSLLSTLKAEKQKAEPGIKRIKVEFTRQEIADMTALRVETVIRMMRKLYDRGILIIERGKVFY
jgi:CRP/FNR family transcriptional regulator, cyclic AMP receptor protein